MPVFPLSRISKSVLRGGTCKSNLRGTGAAGAGNNLYDFADPNRAFQINNINSVSTAGGGAWANTITQTFQAETFTDANITYTSVLSTETSGTLMFRMRLSPASKPKTAFVFRNGQLDTNGYGVYLDLANRLNFMHLDDYTTKNDLMIISNGALSKNVWYHFGIRFLTTTVDDVTTTTVTSYQDTTRTNNAVPFTSPIVAPAAETSLFSVDLGLGTYDKVFEGDITDFVFLEEQMSNQELICYATAPYI